MPFTFSMVKIALLKQQMAYPVLAAFLWSQKAA
jgi:hypothetical protein